MKTMSAPAQKGTIFAQIILRRGPAQFGITARAQTAGSLCAEDQFMSGGTGRQGL